MQRLCTVIGGERERILSLYAAPLATDLPRGEQNRHAHFAALDLLSSALAVDWDMPHCRMKRDENGKPCLIHPKLFVNVSHCRGLAVCAVSAVPVGVDAESPRRVKDSTVARVCAENERVFLRQSAVPQHDFSRLWTLKEAYGKCTGAGIRIPLAAAAFDCSGDGLRFLHPDQKEYGFLQLLLPAGHVVSVCVRHPYQAEQVCCHNPNTMVFGSDLFPKGAFCYAAD